MSKTTKTTSATTATETAKTESETTETVKTFADLLRDYEQATREYLQTPCHKTESKRTETAKALATACTFAVLKKLETASGNKTIADLRRDLARDLNNADDLAYSIQNATKTEYNADGERVIKTADKDLNKASADLTAETISDASDLLQTALLTIYAETAKIQEKYPYYFWMIDTDGKPFPFMEFPYTVRRLKRKVWIKTAESVDGWETKETTVIQEVYKAIRREVESNRSMQIASNKYCYIADLATDEESGDEETIYRRLPKYSGLAEETTDYNGKVTAITADKESAETADRLVESLNLSKQQATILQYRMSGYGRRAIATALGVRDDNIKVQLRRIAEKATASGLFSAELLAKYTKTAD